MTDIAETYGIPSQVMEFANVGFLEVHSEDREDGTIRFYIPSMREQDSDGNTLSYSLKWSRTRFETERGHRANFELVIRHEEADYDYVEVLETTEALIAWLTGATKCVRRRKEDTALPTREELADVFCAILNEWLPSETIAEINRRNALPDYAGCCASHDFCDPNQAMIDAMWSFGLAFEPESDTMTLVDDAWALAKARGFAVPQLHT